MADLYADIVVGDALVSGRVLSFEANAAITKGQAVKFVAVSNDLPKVDVAGATDKAIGIAAKTVAAGERCTVYMNGSIVKVTFGGAITTGNAVRSGANGKVVQLADQSVNEGGTSTYTIWYNMKLGVALQSPTADGDTGLILVEAN